MSRAVFPLGAASEIAEILSRLDALERADLLGGVQLQVITVVQDPQTLVFTITARYPPP